ncbi:hypothetical protein FACS1894168_2260 [Deltaproteobacteria bacterium]|nr:hypothetical protein FACS1894168_2260 [Deltaproteobacteria bacterium]
MAKSLTNGNPAKRIFHFALPLLIGNLFQQFYNMADTLIVGRAIGVEALAAVGSTGSLMFLLIGFSQAMTSGFSIITARYFGAKRLGDGCTQELLCVHPAQRRRRSRYDHCGPYFCLRCSYTTTNPRGNH